MAREYSITIDGAQVHNQGELVDVIKKLNVTMTGTESGCSFSLPFIVDLGPATVETFSLFEELTKEQLVEWVWEQEETVDRYKAHIDLVLTREVEKASLTSKPLPWVPVEVVPPTSASAP